MNKDAPIFYIAQKIVMNIDFHQQFAGKKLLLAIKMSHIFIGNEERFLFDVLNQFFKSIGCDVSIYLLIEDSQIQKNDEISAGTLDDISKIFPVDSFDFVFVTDNLEKCYRPLNALAGLKMVCRVGGSLLLLTRKPAREMSAGVGSNMYWYEDFWRFEEQDILNLFPEDDVQFLSSLEFPDECDENGDTRSLFSQITLRTRNLPITPIKIFNCRARKRIEYDDSNALGYFHHGELGRLGIENMTDKNSIVHNYLDKYEFFLSKFRDAEFTLLELGVFHGGSLRMWKTYFPRAQIVGVDIEPSCQLSIEHRIKIEILDLSRVENLESLKKYQPRIIIDDASHLWSHQILAMSVLFTCLPSGGVYIIEDMETSFKNLIGEGWKDFSIDAYTFCELINRVVESKLKLAELFDESPVANLEIDGINLEDAINEIGLQTELAAVMKGACIFIKR